MFVHVDMQQKYKAAKWLSTQKTESSHYGQMQVGIAYIPFGFEKGMNSPHLVLCPVTSLDYGLVTGTQ